MKPQVLLHIMLTNGFVMLLPVLGGVKDKTFCRWYDMGGGVSAQAWDDGCN